MSKLSYALQLYTVRDHMSLNPGATLRKVKEAGYEYVETADTAGLDTAAFKRLLTEAGLKPVSAHMPYQELVDDVDAAARYARALEVKYLVVPMINRELTPDRQAWSACGAALGRAGVILRDAGIVLCYHNHAQEFQLLDGEYPIDLLLRAAGPENLALELDTFWIKYAGLNPAAMLDKYQGNCPLLHIKDMLDKSKAFAEIGRGIIPWPHIFERALAAGVKWFIVEQDTCAGDSIESARISAIYMGEH